VSAGRRLAICIGVAALLGVVAFLALRSSSPRSDGRDAEAWLERLASGDRSVRQHAVETLAAAAPEISPGG
jgi:hypothetical protein